MNLSPMDLTILVNKVLRYSLTSKLPKSLINSSRGWNTLLYKSKSLTIKHTIDAYNYVVCNVICKNGIRISNLIHSIQSLVPKDMRVDLVSINSLYFIGDSLVVEIDFCSVSNSIMN
jgi:hypothetical protein